MRELEEAAERMGFLESEEVNQEDFDRELVNDPALAEELLAAERELSAIHEDLCEKDRVRANETENSN